MKLGILVVYLVPERFFWMLELQVKMIRAMTADVNYKIYAIALRSPATVRDFIKDSPDMRLVKYKKVSERFSAEHSHYLDLLVECAAKDKCTHFVTLDPDSFPFKNDWVQSLSGILSSSVPLAAVFRGENGDTNLPHPSGLFCEMSFFHECRPKFFPDINDNAMLEQFAEETGQRLDTGIGYALAVSEHGLTWKKLVRSNRVNVHPVMAGVYGDVIFHLGAMGRNPSFRADWDRTAFRRFLYKNQRVPLVRGLFLEKREKIVAENKVIFEDICKQLRDNPEKFISTLV